MVDWAAHYDRIYETLGVDATVAPSASPGEVALTVLDKTVGVTVADDVGVETVRPAFAVRAAELIAKGLTRADLADAVLSANGRSYTVKASRPMPCPAGEEAGEVYLIVSERDAGSA